MAEGGGRTDLAWLARPRESERRLAEAQRWTAPEERATNPLPRDASRGPDYGDLARLDAGRCLGLSFAGHYRIERKIGSGGMATVYAGEELVSHRPVAIKILASLHARSYSALARFTREGLIGTRIRHRNVVDTLDSGETSEGIAYIVLERLEGEDLSALVLRSRETGLSWSRVRALMLQVCAGLAAIHAQGIVHRDVKTSNFVCVGRGAGALVKLIDFGIATQRRAVEASAEEEVPSIVGTPQYMSPEQARGEPADERSDVYAAGIVLCELLTGKRPFHGSRAVELLDAHICQAPPRLHRLAPSGVRVDPAVERIYARALAKSPDDRFPTITSMADAIRAVGGGTSWSRLASGLLGGLRGRRRRASREGDALI